MLILQTCNGEEIGGTIAGTVPNVLALARYKLGVTSFRSNDYIERLNRTLQSELRTLSAYRGIAQPLTDSRSLDGSENDHRDAGKRLVELIIANRGIPEDRVALTAGVTRSFFNICSSIPAKFFEQATFRTLAQLEKGLVEHYESLIHDAPARDIELLKHLWTRTRMHIDDLKKLR